ncbi:molybdate ABC transporter substrate-binding protein [Oceanobacillus piezotolerans]|uniref:molybdate ABC transporter substrate-binding protein n=1 Tax=Oceanobacillus piezotolerans TaxID=2448030 RepID=UPI001314EB31|nr:molybdate ABC transporter substrate-binding protein [Oceanobacillus piezotolerans]
MQRLPIFIIFILIPFIAGCTNEEKIELTISAAASMTNSLNEIKKEFEQDYPHISVTYHFGGSGTLRKQIEQGAPIDLFFSASKKDYQLLEEGGFVRNGSAILQNKLVFIQQSNEEKQSLTDFLHSDGKIAIGTPEAVPAGTYSEQLLKELGIWDKLQGRIILTKDVRQVLTVVKEGAVDVGIVYQSDIHGEENLEAAWESDPHLYEPIQYFAAIIGNNSAVDDRKIDAMEHFYQFIQEEQSMNIFASYGFDTTEALVNQ